jgi:hypothetical protein
MRKIGIGESPINVTMTMSEYQEREDFTRLALRLAEDILLEEEALSKNPDTCFLILTHGEFLDSAKSKIRSNHE